MSPKLTLTIAINSNLFFSLGMFFAPEFVTREQFLNLMGKALMI